ncbi:MAG: cache domain-containing protein, partial [Fibrobacterota bacterium]
RGKLNLLFIAILLVLLLVQGGTIYYHLSQSGRQQAEYTGNLLQQNLRQEIKNYVDIAYETISSRYERSGSREYIIDRYGTGLRNTMEIVVKQIGAVTDRMEAGDISRENARSEIFALIDRARYNDGDGYIFITDTLGPNPRIVHHPVNPGLDGKHLIGEKYNTALGENMNLLAAMRKVALDRDTGYVDYLWPKPGHDTLVEKLSYVSLLREWGWILGTGVYADQVRRDAVEDLRELTGRMRYDDGAGYFWITDTARPYPRMVVHGVSPELNGTILDDTAYACIPGSEKNLFVAFRDQVLAHDNAFVQYLWPKPGDATQRGEKLSYVRLYEPLGWVIGAGMYLDDVKAVHAEVAQSSGENVITLIEIVFLVTAFLLGCALFVYYRFLDGLLIGPLGALTTFAKRVSRGEISHTPDKSNRPDEVGDLQRAFYELSVDLLEKSSFARAVAEGDLSRSFEPAGTKDVLGNALLDMQDNLREMIEKIRGSAQVMKEKEVLLSDNSTKLTEGSENQASAIEEITSTSESIRSMAEQNSSSAAEFARVYTTIRDNLEHGNADMEKMLISMNDIDKNSTEVGTIIQAVEDIAFETNLLALNASVEAARAGVHGKGFSIVADEVRKLAMKSSEAARTTSRLIETALESVKTGKELSQKSAHSMKDTAALAEESQNLIGAVEKLSGNQLNGIEQINSGLDQINGVSADNVQTVESTAEIITQIRDTSGDLQDIIDRFIIDAGPALSAEDMPSRAVFEKGVEDILHAYGLHGEVPHDVHQNLAEQGCSYLVMSVDGIMIDNGVDKELNDVWVLDKRSIRGKAVFGEIISAVEENGPSWVRFFWPSGEQRECQGWFVVLEGDVEKMVAGVLFLLRTDA